MRALQYAYNGQSKTLEEWKRHFKSSLSSSTLSKRLKKTNQEDFEKCFISNRINASVGRGYVGKTIGNIQVLEYLGGRWGEIKCRCHCGKEFKTSTCNIVDRRARSCGCEKSYIGQKNAKYSGFEEISKTFFSRIRYSAIGRNIEFDVKIEYIWDLFIQQGRKCAISGLPIFFNASRSHGEPGNASLDRIDSSRGYVVGNVQWTHRDINVMKWHFSMGQFISYCKQIAEHNKSI